MGRTKKASVSIEPEIWQRIRKIQDTKQGRRLARNPTNLIEKVLIAFIVKHDAEYAEFVQQFAELEKRVLDLQDEKIKGATLGDLDPS